MNKIKMLLSIALAVSLLVVGCGSGSQDASSTQNHEPVTLKIAISMSWLGKDEFKKYFEDPVKEKYPYISFEVLDQSSADYNTMDKIVAKGIVPDIVMQSNLLEYRYIGYDMEQDISPLIKKYNFDLSKLDPAALEAVTSSSGSKVLIGLPWAEQISALYYNKDIFDKYGVPYPTDGMTWEQARDLAAKVTRTDSSVQYRGLEPDQPKIMGGSLSLAPIDIANKKASLNNESWGKVFSTLQSIYAIPGNSGQMFVNDWNQFIKDKSLAMIAYNNMLPNLAEVEGLNWDIAQFPSFAGRPNIGREADTWILHITKQSQHQDDAFKAIATILSEKVQSDMARNGRFPVLKYPNLQQDFGKNLPYLKDKHLEAIFKTQPAKAHLVTKYDAFAEGQEQAAILALGKGQKDVNTALQDAEDAVNKEIAKDN